MLPCWGFGLLFFVVSFPSLPTHPFLVFLQHSVDLSKGCVIIRFSDWPQLPMQARADKSRRANPGAQLAKAAGGQVGMNGASALPPAPRTWQSRCLAPCESGLEGNAVTIHELTSVIIWCSAWRAPGFADRVGTTGLAGAEGRKR